MHNINGGNIMDVDGNWNLDLPEASPLFQPRSFLGSCFGAGCQQTSTSKSNVKKAQYYEWFCIKAIAYFLYCQVSLVKIFGVEVDNYLHPCSVSGKEMTLIFILNHSGRYSCWKMGCDKEYDSSFSLLIQQYENGLLGVVCYFCVQSPILWICS